MCPRMPEDPFVEDEALCSYWSLVPDVKSDNQVSVAPTVYQLKL
jgi:hypothetical protein